MHRYYISGTVYYVATCFSLTNVIILWFYVVYTGFMWFEFLAYDEILCKMLTKIVFEILLMLIECCEAKEKVAIFLNFRHTIC